MMPKPAEIWMDFALDDLDGGEVLFTGGKFNLVCYHAQQAAEKSLKGFMIHNNTPHPKTHDLIDLNKLCTKINQDFSLLKDKLTTLNQFYRRSRLKTHGLVPWDESRPPEGWQTPR